MTVLRWAAFTLAVLCITGVGFAGGDITGLWVLGILAIVVWIFAMGMHRAEFWVQEIPAEPSRLDVHDRPIPTCCLVYHAEGECDDEEDAA